MTTEGLRRRAALVGTALLLAGCSVAPTATPPPLPHVTPRSSVPVSPDLVLGIAPYPGWVELAKLAGTGDGDASGNRPPATRHLLISTVCTGAGSVTITALRDVETDENEVDCPTPRDPQRSMPYLGDSPTWEVDVVTTGDIVYAVLIEGADVPLHIPSITLTSGDRTIEMEGGCWSISLAWGYFGSDQCGTTIPSEPIQTIDVAAAEPATVAIVGWTINQATALCGRLSQGAGQPDKFEQMPACTVQARLEGGVIRLTGLKPSADPWLVEVSMVAEAAWGDAFSGPFYAYVSVR